MKELNQKIDEYLSGRGMIKIRLGCRDCRRLLKIDGYIRSKRRIRKWLAKGKCEKCGRIITIEINIEIIRREDLW